ncbi:hypothetical protein E2320_020191 [Naja naja]|nr:hypothetical protein E2320_020191 [Naja naja]
MNIYFQEEKLVPKWSRKLDSFPTLTPLSEQKITLTESSSFMKYIKMDWIQLVSISLFFILLTVFLLKMNSSWNNNSQNLPPRPIILPFLGNLLIMDLKRPHRTMLKLSKVYGPVFRIQLGFQKIVVLAGYKTVKEALVNHADAFAERPNIQLSDEIHEGFGVLFSHGENWKVMRRFALSALRDYGMGKRTIEDKITEESRFLIKTLESYEGQPFENTAIMNSAVGNIIVSIILGKRYQYEDPTFQRLIKLVNENVQLSGSPPVLFYNMFPLFGFLFGTRKILLNNKKELRRKTKEKGIFIMKT